MKSSPGLNTILKISFQHCCVSEYDLGHDSDSSCWECGTRNSCCTTGCQTPTPSAYEYPWCLLQQDTGAESACIPVAAPTPMCWAFFWSLSIKREVAVKDQSPSLCADSSPPLQSLLFKYGLPTHVQSALQMRWEQILIPQAVLEMVPITRATCSPLHQTYFSIKDWDPFMYVLDGPLF